MVKMTTEAARTYLVGLFDQIETAIVNNDPAAALAVLSKINRDGHRDLGDLLFDGVGEILAERLRKLANLVEARTHTGLTARYCPLCGDCVCPTGDADGEGNRSDHQDGPMDDPRCPLHRPDSPHGGAA